jgi:hypothetical protein
MASSPGEVVAEEWLKRRKGNGSDAEAARARRET